MAAIYLKNVGVDIPIFDVGRASLKKALLGRTIGGRFAQSGSYFLINALKNLDFEKIEPAANSSVRQKIKLKQGVNSDAAKKIVAAIKESGKKAQASIQGDTVRVSSKDRDTLQAIIALLRGKDYGVDLQFTNYR